LEEFRREQLYSREIVLSDTLRSNTIPDSMIKHAENFSTEQKGRSVIPKPVKINLNQGTIKRDRI